MVECITDIIVIVACTILFYVVFKTMKGGITITYKQEFSEKDRQFLEDLYNKEGDPKEKEMQETFDNVVQAINEIMLGAEDQTNG